MENDSLVFKEDLPQNLDIIPRIAKVWKLLIVDDDEEVHGITKMVLKDFNFEGRKLEFLEAYTGLQAKELLQAHQDVAVILLDVVMESDNAGLDLVKWIRDDLKNRQVRIILRTGQPGVAPEKQVIQEYEINDYKAKTELTSLKLFTSVITAIRTFRDMKIIYRSREGFHKVINAGTDLFSRRDFSYFVEGVLTQLTSLLYFDDESLYIQGASLALERSGMEEFTILAGTGNFKDFEGKSVDKIDEPGLRSAIEKAIRDQKSLFAGPYFVGHYTQSGGEETIIVLRNFDMIKPEDQELINLFSTNVAVALENISLNRRVESSQKEIILTLGEVMEARSQETGTHIRRVALICYALAKALGMDEPRAQLIRLASPMHDVGKIGVPDEILNKPGPLNAEEIQGVRKHALYGYEILKFGKSPLLQTAAVIAKTHHERWDGKGYPDGLAGEDIPLEGRIVAVADVFDALSHQRLYKDAWEMEDAFNYIKDNAGTLFDPLIVSLFIDIKQDVINILNKFPED